jgi:hypothetical protein
MTASTLTRAVRWTAGWSVTRDVRDELTAAARVQRPVVAGLRVVVIGGPGVGTTTVASLLALVLAHYRTDRVLAVDAAPGPGSALAARVGVPVARRSPARGPGNLWLVPRGEERRPGRRRHFAVTVTDAGSSVFGATTADPVLAGSHGRVLVVPAGADGDAWAAGLLDRLARARHPLSPTDIVRIAGPGRTRPAPATPGVRSHTVPYDPALAGAGPVRPSAVADATRRAFVRLAAALLTRPGGGSAGPAAVRRVAGG